MLPLAMAFPRAVFAGEGAGGAYNPAFVTFNGSTWFNRASQGAMADSAGGTFSITIDTDKADGSAFYLLYLGSQVQVWRTSANKFSILLYSTTGALICNATVTTPYLAATGQVTLTVAWDMSVPALQVYVNGVAAAFTTTTFAVGVVDYTIGTGLIWIAAKAATNGLPYSGTMTDLYFKAGFTDLSVPANLAKFYTGGAPAKPTDYADIFFGDGQTAAQWNAGQGRGSVSLWTTTGGVS